MTRTLRAAVVLVLAGLVVLGVFATGVTILDDRAADFELHGARTQGLIVSVDPGGPRRSGSIEVRFTVGEVERVRSISLDGLSPVFNARESITVIYDPADPERIAAPGVTNDPEWAVVVLSVLAVGGVATVGVGVVGVVRHLRARCRRRGRPVLREPRAARRTAHEDES